jgi:hypothetical protein
MPSRPNRVLEEVVVNPLRAGLPEEGITTPCSAVFFGASGDLFKRMLLPAV